MTIKDARDEEHGAALSLKSGHVVEMKERHNLKVLLFLATTFVVVAGVILPGAQHYQGINTSLFENRSLQGLFDLCGKNGRFQKIDFLLTTTGITIAQGETKQYKTTVPRGFSPGIYVEYDAGDVKLFLSYLKEKPALGFNDVNCGYDLDPGPYFGYCTLNGELRDRSMYVWIVSDAASTTFTLKVGDYTYVVPPGS